MNAFALRDPYGVPVRDMARVDSFNAALRARQRAHIHRRLSRQTEGFESRIHAQIAVEAYETARDFLRYARANRRNWQ